ncbi:hypothetical protein FO519_002436 [Halicephalobus sp. NKZ332]|nr:hypothetical protein FO519_002436 [Halicephalobus sp. NKZ332]
MPKVVVDGIPVKVEMIYFDDFCDLMKEKGYKVSEVTEWAVQTKDEEKFYDSEEFLKDANKYFSMSLPNLIQTSARLWLACVYMVKDYYLQIGIHAVSHRSLKFLMKFAVNYSSTFGMISDLMEGWDFSEQFHQFSYGEQNFKSSEFESRKVAVEYFVHNFASIDKSAVYEGIMKLVDCPRNDIEFKNQFGNTYLGKKEYQFKYKAF